MPKDFYLRLAMVCRQIPYGKVATYGQLALLCGYPKHARQVGYALRHQLAGDIPAHRIVNHQGFLSGAAAFENGHMQRDCLLAEHVVVTEETSGKYRVDLKKYQWKNTLDDALWLETQFATIQPCTSWLNNYHNLQNCKNKG